MRGLFRAIGAVIAAILRAATTTIVWCARAGAWVTKTVISAFQPAAPVGPERPQVGPVETKPTSDLGIERVKRLAVGLAAADAPAELFQDMPEHVVDWLTAMDRAMLCKVACAKDEAVVRHMRGQETMRGVLEYDQKVVAEYRAVQGLDRVDEPAVEHENRPALAA